jgi:hypothetical protein
MTSSFEIKGLNEIQNKLNVLQHDIEKITKEERVTLNDLFPSSFMRKYTQFSTINEMVNNSPFKVESEVDFKNIPDNDWDVYVREKTSFQSWNEMKSKAAEEYMGKKVQEAIKKI